MVLVGWVGVWVIGCGLVVFCSVLFCVVLCWMFCVFCGVCFVVCVLCVSVGGVVCVCWWCVLCVFCLCVQSEGGSTHKHTHTQTHKHRHTNTDTHTDNHTTTLQPTLVEHGRAHELDAKGFFLVWYTKGFFSIGNKFFFRGGSQRCHDSS